MGIKELRRQFLEYLEIEKGRSLKTVENYDRYLRVFFRETQIDEPSGITDDRVRRFRMFLNRKNLDKKTQNYYLIALRVFLKYLAKRGMESLAPERIDLAKVPQRELDLITGNELERLLSSPKSNDIKTLRDKAILELLFSTGLRVSELCSLSRDQIENAESGEFSVRGKGGKIRIVFISDAAKKAVKDYLDQRTDTEEKLFNLTQRTIERIVKYYAIKAGISKKVTPHVLRHAFATDLLSSGADLRSVQALLGHSNITTTQIYTHITDKQLHEVHRAFHGKRRRNA